MDEHRDIIGHKDQLERAANAAFSGSRVFIYSGPKSTGKRKIARNIARVLNWENDRPQNPQEILAALKIKKDSKNERRWENGTFKGLLDIDFNIYENRKIDNLRDVIEGLKKRNSTVFNKTIIFDNAHRLSDKGFDLFLKNLEDQKDDLWIYIITDQVEDIRPTIRSRSIEVKFAPLQRDQIGEILDSFPEISRLSDEEYETVLRISGGSIEDCRQYTSTGALDILVDLENMPKWSEQKIQKILSEISEEVERTTLYKSLIKYIGVSLLNFSIRQGLKYRDKYIKYKNIESKLEFYAESLGKYQKPLMETALRSWFAELEEIRNDS